MKNIFLFLLITFYSCVPPSEPDISINEKVEMVEDKNKNQFRAYVIRIIDGDTIEILRNKKPIKVRLEHIDCPEKRNKQPFGNVAKQTVAELCFNQTVTIKWNGKVDRYGRVIGEIINENGVNVNKKMVQLGMAWHFKKYSKSEEYAQLEVLAKRNKIGLWKDPKPVPPWKWRSKKKT